MKVLLETTGKFSLTDPSARNVVIRSSRPTVVEKTTFVHQRAILGQLRHLGDVNDDATDAEFKNYLTESDGNVQLAIESFLAAYPVHVPETEEQKAEREEEERVAREALILAETQKVAEQKAEREAVEAEANKGRGKQK